MMFAMALPNIFGAVLLSGIVRRRLDLYGSRYKSGELEPPGAAAGRAES